MVIDSVFVYHFVDPDLRVETFFEKDGAAKNGKVDFEIGDTGRSAHLYWRLKKISFRACLLSYCFFGDKKIAFKSSLDLYFHPSIIELRIEEKIHIKAVDVSRGAGGRVTRLTSQEICNFFFKTFKMRFSRF